MGLNLYWAYLEPAGISFSYHFCPFKIQKISIIWILDKEQHTGVLYLLSIWKLYLNVQKFSIPLLLVLSVVCSVKCNSN